VFLLREPDKVELCQRLHGCITPFYIGPYRHERRNTVFDHGPSFRIRLERPFWTQTWSKTAPTCRNPSVFLSHR
jgi:hypothetical protein